MIRLLQLLQEISGDVEADINSETKLPTAELLERTFRPYQIFTDFTMFPEGFLEKIESVGGHSECSEVLVHMV